MAFYKLRRDVGGVSAGTVVTWRDPSSVRPPTKPVLSVTTTATSATVNFIGGLGIGSITYRLYRGTTATGTPAATSFPFTDSPIPPGTDVTYVMTATNFAGTTISDPVTATTVNTSYFGTRQLDHPFWTTKLDATAPVASTSTNMVSRMVAQFKNTAPVTQTYTAPYNTGTETGAYSIPVYEVPLDTPRVKVWSRSDKYYMSGSTRVNLRDQFQAVPMPDPSKIPGNRVQPTGDDGSIIIICGNELWEFWRLAPATAGTDPDGYDWRCAQGGYMADKRYHPGWWSGSAFWAPLNEPEGGDFGVSAAGMSYLGCMLKSKDFYASDINHPMTIAFPITGGEGGDPERVLPATRNDEHNFSNTTTTNANAVRIPEGVRFRLPAQKWTNEYIEAYAAQKGLASAGQNGTTAATLRKILRCLRDYGMIVGDSAGFIGFSAEANKTYGTPYNPQATAPNWGNFGQQLPYEDFVQVEVPKVQFHTPGAGPTTEQPLPYDFSHQRVFGAGDSLLPVGDLQTADVSSFAKQGVGTIAYDTTWASTGTRSLKFTAGASATRTAGVLVPVEAGSVLPGRKYVASATIRRGSGTKRIILAVQWLNSSGALIGESKSISPGGSVTSTTGGVADVTFTAVAPAGAASANVAVRYNSPGWDSAPASGDVFNVGAVTFKTALALSGPGPVASFTASVTASAATLTWTAPLTNGGSPVTGYVVTRSDDPASVTLPAGTLTTTISGLDASTAVTFNVVAVNDIGNGTVKSVTVTPEASTDSLAYVPTVSGRVDTGAPLSAAGSGWSRNSSSTSGTTVSLTGDVATSKFLVGDRSIYLETNGTGGTAIAHRNNASTTFDITSGQKIVRVLVYIENASQVAALVVRFSNDAYGSANSVSKELDYRFWHEGWNTITFNGNDYYRQDSPNLATMRYVTVSVKDRNNGTPVRAWFNAIWSEPAAAASSKGAVVLSFDDGYASTHDTVLPILNKYGLKGTAYVMPGNFGQGSTWLTETKAMNLADAGWSLAAHAWNSSKHVAMTGAALQTNFDQVKEWLTNHGITRHHLAYWNGLSQTNPAVLAMIKQNFITGRNNLGAGVSLETMRMGQPWGFRGWLNSAVEVGSVGAYPGTEAFNTPARYIKNQVILSKGLIVFTWHNVGSDLPASAFETFAKFVADARDAGDLDVLTIDEASVRAGLGDSGGSTNPSVPVGTTNDATRQVLLGVTTGLQSGLTWNSGVNPAGRASSFAGREGTSDAIETMRGRPFDTRHDFQYQNRNITDGATAWNDLIGMQMLDWFDPAAPAVLGMKPFPTGGSYTAAANGDYDTYLVKIGQTIASKRPAGTAKVVLRLAWEMNGNWYDHTAYVKDSNYVAVPDYVAGSQRIITKIREGAAGRVSFAQSWSASNNTRYQSTYWGDAYADFIGIDSYDAFGSSPGGYHDEATWLSQSGVGSMVAFARAHNKLVSLDEWGGHNTGGNNGGGDNPDFAKIVVGWCRKNADILVYESQFNDTATGNVQNNLWATGGTSVQLPLQRAAYIAAYQA